VGKTTLAKLEMREALQEVPRWNVMYCSFELENSPRDVTNVVNEYFNRAKHDGKTRRLICLDGISNAKDWQKAIKNSRIRES